MKNDKSLSETDSMKVDHLYKDIKALIDTAKQNIVRTINNNMVSTYWNIGMIIVQGEQRGSSRAIYGEQVLKTLSDKLTAEYGSGYSLTNLKYFRQFYLAFQISHTVCDQLEEERENEISHMPCDQLRPELSWSHYRLLMRIKDKSERQFYIEETISQMWSVETLERQINSFYYKRFLTSGGKINEENFLQKHSPQNFLKDPFVMEFLNILPHTAFTERQLEQALIDNLQNFILELGKGFAFVARQQRIVTETSSFYIDLTFYNYLLKCFVIIDLKIGKLSHQDIGQMDMYVRMFDDLKRQEGDNPTIGLILCTEKEETVVKYSVLAESKQLFASKYLLYLPTEEELIKEIEREKVFFELRKEDE
ncbi:putative nuclease of restriction endonuclease-like (RecB) superfamily [Dysgonomonas alginatilytica]|uniref:Putative nuclease of restriction endonuclease-like (RecB) superfamily n=1 Tax=Dysgonomonas alginatilytica TaxID=1605892 RepID=A0A2V3PIM9_9BACT|nr:PDDEXK nuclease domain-containing protein [Dysgonomonas alginatilytica]PXV59403.1 putative nuclease of restriction endonuclease-like (RecB) superfamily [Dysgonomonas alginatilytica]